MKLKGNKTILQFLKVKVLPIDGKEINRLGVYPPWESSPAWN